ncbi:hypothetical protein NUU61_004987 [Penicillium alfredii]|uniref:Uncharacterized protein n=1 Tax=Penicillium alfredii TaxID=1506179 RepID=A0A9W9F8M5_9EURO|nr:uncharacterized protein NUU61_004987 [Penicillium alfredii]KAJ5095631.1 hypothetical protein NUU61_004987 [Penicillium alfredii]
MSLHESLEAPDGSALTWILDHCARYPGSYEIPLRTMYAINSNPAKPVTGNRAPDMFIRNSTSTKSSRSSQDDSFDSATDLRAQLTHQISRLPSQPCSLPPSFITSFLRRCFTLELEKVDFPQALTALDYLKDLETRWKKEMAAALQRLNIRPEDANQKELARKYPGVMKWIDMIHLKGRRLEVLYTQVYIGLRRFCLINEMMLDPYNKANCIALLNTLFPPITEATVAPTPQLTPRLLRAQRDGFFSYITAVETRGKDVLFPILRQGAPEGDMSSWPLIHDVMSRYLALANDIIDECVLVNEPIPQEKDASHHSHKGRKVDSGISFGSTGTDRTSSEDVAEKPLPQFPAPKSGWAKGGSALERLAREIRKLGDGAKSKNLKKMKSTPVLQRPGSHHSYTESSFFEIDEQKRRRLIGEATSRKNSQSQGSTAGSQ